MHQEISGKPTNGVKLTCEVNLTLWLIEPFVFLKKVTNNFVSPKKISEASTTFLELVITAKGNFGIRFRSKIQINRLTTV